MRPLCWKIRIEGLQMFIWKLDLKARGHLIELFDRSMGGRLVNIGKHGGEDRGFLSTRYLDESQRKLYFLVPL